MVKEKRMNWKSKWRSLLFLAIPFAIVLVATTASLAFVRSGVPSDLYLLTGAEGSKFYNDGLQYKAKLAEYGVDVHIEVTPGSADNLQRLVTRDRPLAGFAEAGMENFLPQGDVSELLSLGSLYVEPGWLFVRRDAEINGIERLVGKRVVMGVKGSGARSLAELLITAIGIEDQVISQPFEELGPKSAIAAIVSGEIDALFMTGPPGAPGIAELLRSQAVRPMSFRRAPAYARRFEYLAEVELPEGSCDLALNVPGEDLQLISFATNLVVSEDLHPSIVDLLLSVGREIHGNATLFTSAGRFPSAEHSSLPLSPAATRFFKDGPSPIHKLVPFWLASLIDRFFVVICTVATASVAAFSILPRLLTAKFDLSLILLSKQLVRIENSSQSSEDKSELLEATDKLLARSAELRPPTTKTARYLEFRQSVHDTRDRLKAL